jgi:hypothetical protein
MNPPPDPRPPAEPVPPFPQPVPPLEPPMPPRPPEPPFEPPLPSYEDVPPVSPIDPKIVRNKERSEAHGATSQTVQGRNVQARHGVVNSRIACSMRMAGERSFGGVRRGSVAFAQVARALLVGREDRLNDDGRPREW